MNTTFKQILQKNITQKKVLSIEDLKKIYIQNFPTNEKFDFFWAFQHLKENKIIIPQPNNSYKIHKEFEHTITPLIQKIHHFLDTLFNLKDTCIWTSEWYNQFSKHQLVNHFVVIESEKEIVESIFECLKEQNFENVFLVQTKKEEQVLLNKYAFESNLSIIIKKMISKSPIQMIEHHPQKIQVPCLEKMLLDLFTDEFLFQSYDRAEKYTIFENILDNYVIDFKKIFAYAQRRGNEKELKKYLFENFEQTIDKLI